MDDLLDKFEALIDEYKTALDATSNARMAHDILRLGADLRRAALDVVDFLIEFDATVTFPAPSPSAPAWTPEDNNLWTEYDAETKASWTKVKRDERP